MSLLSLLFSLSLSILNFPQPSRQGIDQGSTLLWLVEITSDVFTTGILIETRRDPIAAFLTPLGIFDSSIIRQTSLSLSLSRSLPCTTVSPVVVCSTCKDFCPMATFTGGFCMRGDRTELCMSRAQISINLLSAWLRLLTAPNIHSTSGCVAEELGL